MEGGFEWTKQNTEQLVDLFQTFPCFLLFNKISRAHTLLFRRLRFRLVMITATAATVQDNRPNALTFSAWCAMLKPLYEKAGKQRDWEWHHLLRDMSPQCVGVCIWELAARHASRLMLQRHVARHVTQCMAALSG